MVVRSSGSHSRSGSRSRSYSRSSHSSGSGSRRRRSSSSGAYNLIHSSCEQSGAVMVEDWTCLVSDV